MIQKTPDEIKKRLNVLYPPSVNTSYEEYVKAISCIPDALALIQRLERERDKYKRERDAAIEDIKKAAMFLCQTCKKYHPAIIDGSKHFCDEIPADHFDDGAIACGMYEWRGVEEE